VGEVGPTVEQGLESLVVALHLEEQIRAQSPGLELAGDETARLAIHPETLEVLLFARVLEGDAAIELPGLEELPVDSEHRREPECGLAVVRVLDEERAIEVDRLAMLALIAGAVRIVPDLVLSVAAVVVQGRRQLTSPELVRSSCRIGGLEA
jgi:hypothetical protein